MKNKKEVAFLKKSSAKNFYELYMGDSNVLREQKFFAELFYRKAAC
jgi:hypothetical protein